MEETNVEIDGCGWYKERRWLWVSNWVMAYFFPILSLLLRKVSFKFRIRICDEDNSFTGITYEEDLKRPDGYIIEGKINGPEIYFKKAYDVHSDNPNHVIYRLKRCGNGDIYKGEWKFYVFDYSDLDYCSAGKGQAKIQLSPKTKIEKR